MLELDVEKVLPRSVEARLPDGVAVRVLPSGLELINLDWLSQFANPRLCSNELHRAAAELTRNRSVRLATLRENLRSLGSNPVHALWHLLFKQELVSVVSEREKRITLESEVTWRSGAVVGG